MDANNSARFLLWTLVIALALWGSCAQETCGTQTYSDGEAYFNNWEAKWAGTPDIAQRMFPYGNEFCDTTITQDFQKEIPIPTPVTFYGRVYDSVYVVTSQPHISFGKPSVISMVAPLPNVFYPNQIDPVIASPFYSSVGLQQGEVYYRFISKDNLDKPTLQTETLRRVEREVVGRVMAGPEYSSFTEADFVLIVTWVDAIDLSCVESVCPKNTFQVVMAVQGENTVFMFNYEKLEWTAPSSSAGCQHGAAVCPNLAALAGFNAGQVRGFTALPHSGTDSLVQLVTTRGASVAGRFLYHTSYDNVIRGGCTDDPNILNTAEWHIEIFSRRVHMLGGVEIYVNGPCFAPTDTIKCAFGSEDKVIEVTGYAVADSDETSDVSYMASCVTPFLPWAGLVPVSILYNGQAAYSAEIYVMSQPEQFAAKEKTGVEIADLQTTAFLQNPESLTLSWNPTHLRHVFESAQPQTVDVTLFAYRENPNAIIETGESKIEWGVARRIAEGVTNSGSFTFNTAEHRCSGGTGDNAEEAEEAIAEPPPEAAEEEDKEDEHQPVQAYRADIPNLVPNDGRGDQPNAPSLDRHNDIMHSHPGDGPPHTINAASTDAASDCGWQVGAIKVSVSGAGVSPERARGLWTTAIPLGWYSFHNHDPIEMCDAWYNEYESSRGRDNTLPVCPCTQDQALAEGTGRFTIDQDCVGETSTCYWNPGSTLCLVSTTPSSSGGASRCCYGQNGFLAYAGDSQHGSFSSRAHFEGGFPYAQPGRVPLLSHWLHDLLPHLACCDWTDDPDSCIHRFMAARPTRDCSTYHSPGLSTGYGDPHFMTMDGSEYTYNGKGEFWLLRTITTTPDGEDPLPQWDHIRVQVRLEQPAGIPIPNPDAQGDYPDPLATAVTAIVLQEGPQANSDVPKIEIRMSEDSNLPEWQFPVSVYVDGTFLDLAPETGSMAFRQITNSDHSRNYVVLGDTGRRHLTVVLPSGISVQAATVEKTITFTLALPSKYMDITEGLMGIWNHDKSDDLTPKGGGSVSDVENFAFSWITTAEESIFTYVGLADWYSFAAGSEWQPVLEPTFPDGVTFDETTVNNLCETSENCKFDYMATLNEKLAKATKVHQKTFFDRANHTGDVPVCARPNIPEAYVEAVDGYREGAVILVTGCADGYSLKGSKEYTCILNTEGQVQWSSEVNTECADSALEAWKVAMAVVVPVVLIILIAIVGIIAYIKYGKKRGDSKGAYNAGAKNRRPPEVATSPDVEKEAVTLTGSMPQPARPLRSSMERIRIPPDEAASEDYAPRRDSYSTDEDSYTPNSSQHQDYRQDDPDMQPHDHYGSAV